MRAARRRVEDWHGAVASDTARGSGPCTSGVIMSQGGSPDVPSQGLDLVEPVMYLSWTDDVPIVTALPAPVTCLDHQAAKSACCCCERGARPTGADPA